MSINFNSNIGFSTIGLPEQSGDVVLESKTLTNLSHNQGYCLSIDGDYLYFNQANFLVKINKNTLELEGSVSVASTGIPILEMLILGDFIYTISGSATASNRVIRKRNKSNLSLVASSTEQYGGTPHFLLTDGSNLYIGGATTRQVWKYNTDLTRTAVSSTIGYDLRYAVLDNENIYVRGANNTHYWVKMDLATLTTQLTSSTTTISYSTASVLTIVYKPFILNGILYQPLTNGAMSRLNLDLLNNFVNPAGATHSVFHIAVGKIYNSTQYITIGSALVTAQLNLDKTPISYYIRNFSDDISNPTTAGLSTIVRSSNGRYRNLSSYTSFVFDENYLYIENGGWILKVKI